MTTRPPNRRGFTLIEMLVAAVIGVLVVTGAVLLFISSVRLSIGMQGTSFALRKGSVGIDQLRLPLREATALQLPDDTGAFLPWSASLLGSASQYQSTGKLANQSQTLNTAIYLSRPSNRTMQLLIGTGKTQATSIAVRRIVTTGTLLYRADIDGKPNPSSGTYLWMWTYNNGALLSRSILCRKLASTWDAVAFRRGNASGSILRYRLVMAEQDSYNQARSQFGKETSNNLEASDYAISLLNFVGGSVPDITMPTQGNAHP